MIRRMNISDKDSFFNMSKEFYESGAALQNIPERNIIRTFDTIISGSPYADAYIISSDGNPAGYALLAITYSNEAGGIVAWIEEIYILNEYRGKGLGAKLIEFIEEEYKDKAVNQFSGYEMVEYLVKDEGSGSFDVVYYYRLKDGTNPYKSITVYYVDEDGNAIDDPYVVKNVPVNTSVTKWAGDEANKREYLYDEIYTEDGLYEFVTYAAKDEDNIINVYYRLKGATDPEDPDDPDNSGDDDRRPPYIPPTGNSDRDDNDNDTTTINDDDTALAPGPGDGTSSAPGGEMGDAVPGTPGGANPGDPSEVIGDDAVPQVEAPQTGRQVAGSLALLAGAAVVATLTLRRKKK